MGGLLILVALVAWGALCWWISGVIAPMVRRPWSKGVHLLLAIPLFLIPVADEIVGKRQFAAICKKQTLFVDESALSSPGSVKLGPYNYSALAGFAVPVYDHRWTYVDSVTGKKVIDFSRLKAEGGWLSRNFVLAESKSPLLFEGYCAPSGADVVLRSLKLRVIDRDAR